MNIYIPQTILAVLPREIKNSNNKKIHSCNCTYSPLISFCFSATNAATYSFIFCKEESQVGKEVPHQKQYHMLQTPPDLTAAGLHRIILWFCDFSYRINYCLLKYVLILGFVYKYIYIECRFCMEVCMLG